MTPDTWTENTKFRTDNSICEIKVLTHVTKANAGPSRLHEFCDSKLPFISRIEFTRSNLSKFLPVYPLSAAVLTAVSAHVFQYDAGHDRVVPGVDEHHRRLDAGHERQRTVVPIETLQRLVAVHPPADRDIGIHQTSNSQRDRTAR